MAAYLAAGASAVPTALTPAALATAPSVPLMAIPIATLVSFGAAVLTVRALVVLPISNCQ
jgi:hypothetical protein